MSEMNPSVRPSPRAGSGPRALMVAVASGWALVMFWISVRLATGPALMALGVGELPPLPAYRLELSGDAEPHGSPSGGESLTTGEMLTVLLRPVEPVAGPVTVKAYVGQGDHRRLWAVHFERSDAGAFLLRAPVRSLPGLGPGRWQLTFLIGRPWALPRGPRAAREREPEDDWYLLEGTLEILAS